MTTTVSTSAQQTVSNFNNWFSDNIYSICHKTTKYCHQSICMQMFGNELMEEFVLFRVDDYGKAFNLFRIMFDIDAETVVITIHSYTKRTDEKITFNINELDVEHDYKLQKKELKAYFEKN